MGLVLAAEAVQAGQVGGPRCAPASQGVSGVHSAVGFFAAHRSWGLCCLPATPPTQVVVEDLFLHSLGLEPLTVVGCAKGARLSTRRGGAGWASAGRSRLRAPRAGNWHCQHTPLPAPAPPGPCRFEGLYGVLLMCAVLPVVQVLPGQEGAGIHEDSIDTLAQLAHSPRIRAAVLWLMCALTVYNLAGEGGRRDRCTPGPLVAAPELGVAPGWPTRRAPCAPWPRQPGMLVTDSLGAVTRTVLETLKTLLVWVLDLLAFYASGGQLGEAWTRHSWLQAAGFVALVGGTMVGAALGGVGTGRGRDRSRRHTVRRHQAEPGRAGHPTTAEPHVHVKRPPSLPACSEGEGAQSALHVPHSPPSLLDLRAAGVCPRRGGPGAPAEGQAAVGAPQGVAGHAGPRLAAAPPPAAAKDCWARPHPCRFHPADSGAGSGAQA